MTSKKTTTTSKATKTIAAKLTQKKSSKFEKGSGCYNCKSCTRKTRATENGDATALGLCAQCFEIGGIENQISDGGYETPAEKRKLQLEIQEYEQIIIAKGGVIKERIVVDVEGFAQVEPVTPLTKLLTGKGFTYVKSEAVDAQNTAHGYNHEDGRGALFIHANTSDKVGARWVLIRDGKRVEGKTAKELAAALVISDPLPANVLSALDLLRKATKGSYRLALLAGDDHYTARVQMIKKLRNTDKVLAKDSGLNKLSTLFYAALNVETSVAFETKCAELFKLEAKAERAVARVEKNEVKEQIKQTGGAVLVHDNKPVLPGVKKVSTKKQRETDEKAKVELAAQIAHKRKQEEYTPLAVPRPEAQIAVNIDDVCLLVDPTNGITLFCLEKPNSQGAICVYNNGSRVAAGVVPTETLVTLRREVSTDLVKDLNDYLHPITAGVIVTDVAESHLTAVLDRCKEITDMATEKIITTKKFAAPKNVAAKAVATKSAAKAEKAPKAAKAPKESTRVKFADDLKIKALVKENPYREGTKARNSFDFVLKAKNFGELNKSLSASKKEVYEAAYILKWASQPHGKAPAYVTLG